jgi:hypothetical protein
MNCAMAPSTEGYRVGDFGHAAMGEPIFVVGIPALAKMTATPLTPTV